MFENYSNSFVGVIQKVCVVRCILSLMS